MRHLLLACMVTAAVAAVYSQPDALVPRSIQAAEPAAAPVAERPSIELAPSGGERPASICVHNLSREQRQALHRQRLSLAQWQDLLNVTVGDPAFKNPPAMLGDYSVQRDAIIFVPRYPLRPGLRYRVVFNWTAIDPESRIEPVIKSIAVEDRVGPRATIAAIFPSANVLPENLLKFYLHFSAPMSRGEAYRRVHLVEAASGTEIEHPFLELGEELWDPSGTRFTLFFDPGRIKRGLQPREIFGPALEEGRSYRLIIDSDWCDAEGRPLASGFSKAFEIVSPDVVQPSSDRWKVVAPAAETRKPLAVRFDEPLDHAMLERVLQVHDAAGHPIRGDVRVQQSETLWQFVPHDPWSRGTYQLVVETTLEDLAGNSLGRPFEVDVFETIEREVATEYIRIGFDVDNQE